MQKSFSKEYTQAVKGLAIIMLVIYHCFATMQRLSGYEVTFIFPVYGMQWANQCNICVGIFTFLSAYGICKSLKGSDPFHDQKSGHVYFTHRITNLMCNYWIILIPCMIISAILGLLPYDRNIYGLEDFALDFLGLSGLVESTSLCGTWWYISLALMVIILVPIFLQFSKKRGMAGTLLMMFLLMSLSIPVIKMTKWLLLVPIGVWCAKYNIIERMETVRITRLKALDQVIKIAVLAVLTYNFSYLAMSYDINWKMQYVYHPLAAFVFVLLTYIILSYTPLLRKGLGFLGKHSMNIFLVHTFIRSNWLNDFTYSLGSTWKIFLFVFSFSLLISIGIELLKKLIHYKKFENKLESILNSGIEKIHAHAAVD